MKQSLLDKFMTTRYLAWTFWVLVVVMVSSLLFFTANLGKEIPPIPELVRSENGEVLYEKDDIVQGKAYFQEFDLTDWGSFLGMGAYIGPDFSTDFFHNRAVYLYNYYGNQNFGKGIDELNLIERGAIKEMTKIDFNNTFLRENEVIYTEASALAYKNNIVRLQDMLLNGDPSRGYPGGFIKDGQVKTWDGKIETATAEEKVEKIAAFIDWSQLVASSPRLDYETGLPENDARTWSNDWPNEPLVDQDISWRAHVTSLWAFLLLWVFSIFVVFLGYMYFFKPEDKKDLEKPLKVTKMFPSQTKLLKYVPVVVALFVLQMFLGGYLAHIYIDPTMPFTFPGLEKIINIPQEILPFNAIRSIHTQLAILWIAVGWLVGGLMIAPWVAGKDHKIPWLVDVLWIAILIIAVGSLAGLYAGATGMLPESWFWLGNEGRELINLGRLWDFALVGGLVFWFLMIVSLLKKATTNNPLASVIVWSSFAIAGLYVAGMIPFHQIMPNFTVDDFYRWWVIHLWVELTFELFAVGVIAFFTVSLGLVSQKSAVKLMLFELVLVMFSGTLGVGHHYWWQGLDSHWIAIGGIFSALEPVPLVLLIVEAWNNYREKTFGGEKFEWGTVFMWISGSAVLNFIGAGFLGMVINTPTINYYSHGTYLIMPHGHVALLGAFGYIAIAFLYLVVRSYALSNKHVWNTKLTNTGFWLLTIGLLLFALPTIIIGFHQAGTAFDMGYYAARLHESLAPVEGWMWFRVIPDTMMLLGGIAIFFDLVLKIFFGKKANTRRSQNK
ncbi:MAG: cbb3-type cytochrome c oxidase subunit I [Candidatus Gracilibacteria bacterium]|nr:cbb3-type cytochrome c oxidase subunit I [Candidatus Gracilibacteria bacterium]